MTPAIEIHIEALVLDGIGEVDGERLVEAMEAELAELARAGRIAARPAALERASASIEVSGRSASALGRGLARVVWVECIGDASPGGGAS